jgi:Meckel syndrome type 1 protein
VAKDGPHPATPSANASPKALETPSRTPADTGQQQQQPNKDGLPANAAAVAQQVARVANREPRVEQTPAPAPAAPQAPPVAPTAPTAGPRGLAHATPVPLSRAAEAVENVLRLASSRGVTHARIALRPVELGSIDVHLRSTAEGLVARVVAHSPDAVQQLQQAANDLRRSLEEQGLNLLNLDIGASGERFAGRSGADAGELASGGAGTADDSSVTDEGQTDSQTSTLRLPDGVLVDVLA